MINPLETCEDLKEIFHGIYREFCRHAMIVALFVPAEVLFSKFGATTTEERNCLKVNEVRI